MEKNLESFELLDSEEEKGATALEYALLAALIAVVVIVAVTFLGQSACQAFSRVGSSITTAAAAN